LSPIWTPSLGYFMDTLNTLITFACFDQSGGLTSRNQPKCNHSIYDYLQLHFKHLQLQDQISTILVILTTMMQLLENFILLVALILHWFSSINTLICPISCNSHQISCILKVFYNDIGVYFNVCTQIIYICMHMYIVHIMNLKINIWTLNFLFKSENWYFNYENYFNFKGIY